MKTISPRIKSCFEMYQQCYINNKLCTSIIVLLKYFYPYFDLDVQPLAELIQILISKS